MANPPGKRGKPPVKSQAGNEARGKQPPAKTLLSAAADESFDFGQIAQSTPTQRVGKKKESQKPLPLILGIAAALCLVAVAVGFWLLRGEAESELTIRPIEAQAVDELTALNLTAEVDATEELREHLEFRLDTAPEGALIDPQSGRFSWQPTELQGPGSHEVIVSVADSRSPERRVETRFTVDVREVNAPPVLAPLADRRVEAAETIKFTVEAEDPDQPAAKLKFDLLPGGPAGAQIDANSGEFQWDTSTVAPGKEYEITIRVSEDSPGGLKAQQSFSVRVEGTAAKVDELAGQPDATAQLPEIGVAPPVKEPADPIVLPPVKDDDAPLLELYREEKLFLPTEYATLRKFFADRFQRQHQDEIQRALGDDLETMTQWFDEHPAVREEFFTAIDPQHDKVVETLELFAQLKQRNPEQTARYWNLAIATAVTWDDVRPVSPNIGSNPSFSLDFIVSPPVWHARSPGPPRRATPPTCRRVLWSHVGPLLRPQRERWARSASRPLQRWSLQSVAWPSLPHCTPRMVRRSGHSQLRRSLRLYLELGCHHGTARTRQVSRF